MAFDSVVLTSGVKLIYKGCHRMFLDCSPEVVGVFLGGRQPKIEVLPVLYDIASSSVDIRPTKRCQAALGR